LNRIPLIPMLALTLAMPGSGKTRTK
jgi:hypothetical protein